MRLLNKAVMITAVMAALPAFSPADSGGAGLRTIRSMVNRKEYAKAEESLREELPGMRGRTRDQAKLMLADLRTEPRDAVSILEDIIRSGDNREALKARVELAKIHYSTGEYHQVVRILDGIRAKGRGGDKYEAVYFRGLSRQQLGDLEGARRDFESIDRGDFLHWSYISLADLDIRSGRITEAVEKYETIAAGHSSPIAGFRLGECYELTGEREKALKTYMNVARNFPGSPEAPKAREKVQMIDSALKRTGRESKVGGGEQGETPSAVAASPLNGSPVYTLQFGAFGEKKNAHAFISDLESMIDDLHIEVGESGGSLWYRVRAGRFASREEAEEAALNVMERTGYSSKVLPVE
jgi:tetratricopeptide (TPR) repeat protein